MISFFRHFSVAYGIIPKSTFVNAYAPSRAHARAVIEKMIGKSEFKGHTEESEFFDRWDTHL